MDQEHIQLPARWTRGQRLKNTVIYVVIRLLLAVTSLLPLMVTARLGAVLGWIGYWLDWGDRRRAMAHLELAYGEGLTTSQRRAITRGMFTHLGRMAGEALRAPRIMAEHQRYIDFTAGSRERYQAAVARGKGIILVSGHIGNWELLGAALAPLGEPLRGVAKPTYDPRLTRLAHRLRTAAGFDLLWRGDRPLKDELYDILGRGQTLLLLIDQDMKVPGVFVDFFGTPAHTPRAPASMALKTGAALLVCHLARNGSRHMLDLQEIPAPPGTEVIPLMQQLSDYLEHAIRAHPSQWVWLHRRWKTRPPRQEAS